MHELQLPSSQDIQRAIWIVLATLVASTVLFGGYYYWDRYVYLGDKSPLELEIERMEEAIRQNPQDVDARVMLAEYYLEKGMHREALDQTNQVLSLSPQQEGALLIHGIAHALVDCPEDALDPLERFIELRQERPMAGIDTALETAYYFLGESYVQLDRPAEAIVALEAALTVSPVDADALYQLGRAYQASDQPQVALEHYHRAVRLVPDFSEAYAGMIQSYSTLEWLDHVIYAGGMQALCRQDYETARAYLESAAQALPDFAPAFLGLGLAYEKTGDLEAALTAIQRALELDPSDYAAQHARGRIQAALNSRN
jgi:tetratricopeptide (TPR) repeat protein